jgi:CheY-like chemotaxis protein
MGGELKVESVHGEGSRFFFTLPLVPAADDAVRLDAGASQPTLDARLAADQHATALVVDDSTVSRRILASLLESAGFRVITATGGLEGINLAKRHLPDVIFMDVKMADLDGFSATRRLADDTATARIPVIAVTASAFGDTRQAAKDAGCAAYLPKPVRAEALFATLQAHLGVKFVRADAGPTVPSEMRLNNPAREAEIVARIREALAIGGISDLEALADELAHGGSDEVAVGQRLARLVANFDFEGLKGIVTSLSIGSPVQSHDGRHAD